MNRPVVLAVAIASLGGEAHAQYWRPLGLGTVGVTEIQTLYGDSISDRLLAGGTFTWIQNVDDTLLGMGQAAWNGSRWDSVAHRIAPSVLPTFWFLRFQGELYACGAYLFYDNDGNVNLSFARLDDVTHYWEALECTNPFPQSGLVTIVPKVPDTTLYATGYMGSVCGLPESCVFRYDGSAFHSWAPFDLIPPDNNNYVGTIFDYKGKTYLTGSVRDPVEPGYAAFLRWTGTAWEHVPGWNTLSPIKEILIHNDTLYVGGAFRYETGGPGNLIARFDGENWDDMGGGLAYLPVTMSGAALDLEWWHGELLVSGFFNRAGNVPCSAIAKWNGHQWCNLPGEILWQNNAPPTIYDMAIWRDSLYICGGIATIDGEPVRQVAQWIGGEATGECSTVGITTPTAPARNLVVNPLPAEGQWAVHFPGPDDWTVTAYDAAGQKVGEWRASGTALVVDLTARSQGLYLLVASTPPGTRYSAKIVRP